MAAQNPSAWDEVIDFLLSRPSPEQIVAFEGSENFRERVRHLREMNRNSSLSDTENSEMNEIGEVGDFVRRLKIRALEKMAETEKLPQP